MVAAADLGEAHVGGAVLPAPRRAIGLEECAARGAIVGGQVGLAHVRRPRDVGPPVTAALQAGIERRTRADDRLPLERRTHQ